MREAFLWLRALAYRGREVYCPCCGGSFSEFLSVVRPNAVCPRCESLERHRLLWLYLRERTDLFSARLRVLQFAPEHVIQKNLLALRNIEYISADLVSPLAQVRMDITRIGFRADSFDAILCSHVLEHVQDDGAAMRELRRVLRPRGWAILQVPLDPAREQTFEDSTARTPSDRARVYGQSDHVRIYGRDYKDRLQQAGFCVRVDDYVRRLGAEKVRRYGLMEDEDLYFCTKGVRTK